MNLKTEFPFCDICQSDGERCDLAHSVEVFFFSLLFVFHSDESQNKIFNKNPNQDSEEMDAFKSSSSYIRSKQMFQEIEWKTKQVLNSLPYFFNFSDTGEVGT